MSGKSVPAEIAYYYPEPFWLAREGGWIKNLLLLFDEIAILLPSYMGDRHVSADPTLAGPLEERGLLRVLEPETFIDDETAAKLTEAVGALVDGGAFDELPEIEGYLELSKSRAVLATPKRTGDAGEEVRETGARHGLNLHPVTDASGAHESFCQLLELEPMPSRGRVVDLDLQTVGLDLDDIPLDEVLDFKRDSDGAHRRYMKNLRSFALELSMLEEVDRAKALADRQKELEEEAQDLRQRSLRAWRNLKDVSAFSLGMAGAAWSVATANPVPAALAAVGAGLKMLPSKADGGAYSYLFDARRRLQ